MSDRAGEVVSDDHESPSLRGHRLPVLLVDVDQAVFFPDEAAFP